MIGKQAPFEDWECTNINEFQLSGHMHPFTCPRDRSVLVAVPAGMRCPACDYEQDWVHDFMADGGWRATALRMRQMLKNL